MNNVMGVTSDWDCFLFRSAQVQPQFLFLGFCCSIFGFLCSVVLKHVFFSSFYFNHCIVCSSSNYGFLFDLFGILKLFLLLYFMLSLQMNFNFPLFSRIQVLNHIAKRYTVCTPVKCKRMGR